MSNKKPDQIKEETVLSKILEIPGAEEILGKYNLPCLSCPMAGLEMQSLKIGEIAKIYNLDLENMLKDLNQLLEK